MHPDKATTTDLLSFLATGAYSAPEIQRRLNCSQSTASRLLAKAGTAIVTIGKARARRYARRREIPGTGSDIPVYKIDIDGNAHLRGTLLPITPGDFLWRPVDAHEQLFRSLPWFLADLHPDGFVGRAFVRRWHQELGLPPRATDWSENHVLTALARRGEDTMGNLVIGQESLERYFQMTRAQAAPVPQESIPKTYVRLADEAMNGQPCGSSAGGEQPKFTAVVERDGVLLNVLVKFSPPLNTEAGRRWADLLICEDLALRIIQESAGIPSSKSNIVMTDERLFLEVVRFDRAGQSGRLSIVSLRAVDSEFIGVLNSWCNAAARMETDGRLSTRDASNLRWLSAFGSLIGNNDQHFGNVSLVMNDRSTMFELAPAYDMLPMFYQPSDGFAPNQSFEPPSVFPGAPKEWPSALSCALRFWDRASLDPRISNDFRSICLTNRGAVQRLQEGPRLVG